MPRTCDAVATGFLAAGRCYATFPRQRPTTRCEFTKLRAARRSRLAWAAASRDSWVDRVSASMAWNCSIASREGMTLDIPDAVANAAKTESVDSINDSDRVHSCARKGYCVTSAGTASSWQGDHSAVQSPAAGRRNERGDYRTPSVDRLTFTWPTGPSGPGGASCPAWRPRLSPSPEAPWAASCGAFAACAAAGSVCGVADTP